MYRDKMGRPLSLTEWADLFEDSEYRIVSRTEFPATALVPVPSHLSTVWLGLDHNFFPGGPPIIFETMRFQDIEKISDEFGLPYRPSTDFPDPEAPKDRTDQVRYSTEEQARLGHAHIVRLIQELEMQ